MYLNFVLFLLSTSPTSIPPGLISEFWVRPLEQITWQYPKMALGKISFLEEEESPAQLDLCRPEEKELGLKMGPSDCEMFVGSLSANTTTPLKGQGFPAGSRPLRLTIPARI